MNPLNDSEILERLKAEYELSGRIIVAYDFDNTVALYRQEDPEPTKERPPCVPICDLIKALHPYTTLVLWTARNEFHYKINEEFSSITEAINWLNDHNIPYDFVNDIPSQPKYRGRKLNVDILLDDRAGLSAAYSILVKFLMWVREKENEHL